MAEIKFNKYFYHPELDNMEIINKWETWVINGHSDGDIEIECNSSIDGSQYLLFLNQDQLKQLIEFLQTKVK